MPARDAIFGSLLSTAVGDALGLPFEGLSRRRVARLRPSTRYRFLLGRGMVSDDTDHAALVVLALAASAGDPDRFERTLRRSLARWFLTLPAGIGLATARSCIRMCLGVRRSGVRSAGNGPAIRAAALGAAMDDSDLITELVKRSTELTHTDPRAFHGALAVALAGRHLRTHAAPDRQAFRHEVHQMASDIDTELLSELDSAIDAAGTSTADFALARGHDRAVGGFIVHSVPVALHAALAHPDDPTQAALACIACGGDTDTTAAIAAGIVGARTGPPPVSNQMGTCLLDWPRGTRRIEAWCAAAQEALDTGVPARQHQPLYLFQLARNVFFLAVVLAHAFRRALPPY